MRLMSAKWFLVGMALCCLAASPTPNGRYLQLRAETWQYLNPEQVAEAEFDLARLTLANRLWELAQDQTSAGNLSALASYFPEMPTDPFSLQSYLWSAEEECFYSIGPDQKDEQNAIEYDPTNGVTSSGDIGWRRNREGAE